MPRKTSQSNQISGKIQIFQDFTALADYTNSIVCNEPQVIVDKTFTYLACRAPRLWNKNAINLLVVLARIEATLEKLTSQHEQYFSKEILSTTDIKACKEISTACAGLVTQLHTLTNRLGISEAQLNGGAMRHETLNTNSREIADLVLSNDSMSTRRKPQKGDALTLAEAKFKASKILENINE